MENFYLESFDGTKLYCYLWADVKEPKAVVQLSHGMSEYLLRYDRFAVFLNSKGYIVFGDDHRGHGLTESDKDRGGHKGDIFNDTVKDLVFIHNYLKNKYNLPQVFFGHSYGSFLGQAFLEQNTGISGVALAGTSYIPRFVLREGTHITLPLYLICKNWRPSFINKMSDLTSQGHYKGEKGASLWLTRDKEIRQKFIDDPLSGVNMSINFCFCMLKGVYNTWKKKNTALINKKTPIGLFCGSMDPIGSYGKGVNTLYDKYKALGVEKIEKHIYKDDRHEVINELDYETVYADILKFFENCLA